MYRSKIELHNVDCMEFVKGCEDNQFDLAIVDPPYGIGANKKRADTGRNSHIKQKDYHVGDWDISTPSNIYFKELIRVSQNQIIWGGNYFLDNLQSTPCMIVWDKDNGTNDYADCELAWSSFKTSVRLFKWKWHGFLQQDMKNKETRIHPTQKPVALYKWLLSNYANEGDSILDTHLGSGSIAIACDELGFDLTGCELDKNYYDAAIKRLEGFRNQTSLF